MSTAARDYALPDDGNTHPIPCGDGPVLAAEHTRDGNHTWVFLWVRQDYTHPAAFTDRHFTTRIGRDPWPTGAHHIASLRDLDATVHVLEIP